MIWSTGASYIETSVPGSVPSWALLLQGLSKELVLKTSTSWLCKGAGGIFRHYCSLGRSGANLGAPVYGNRATTS